MLKSVKMFLNLLKSVKNIIILLCLKNEGFSVDIFVVFNIVFFVRC